MLKRASENKYTCGLSLHFDPGIRWCREVYKPYVFLFSEPLGPAMCHFGYEMGTF